MERIPCTLCFVVERDRVLLGMKKRGFGMGKWNGYGGKIEPGESPHDAAIRETYEESGITVVDLEAAGHLTFVYPTRGTSHDVSLFRAHTYTGTVCETDEMRSEWFLLDCVPYDEMWVDDPLWLPQFLKGEPVTAEFVFQNDDTITRATVSSTS